ncbi:predicted protein [Naegleria gruberi]|uniref:Predicted protein n=1 Tax=Naegleria gruberi TaxID=5762 RepID=D2V5R9_NAEGR|nr:uncharacterized protein NAEGRDRAFT_64179 [Naegleria gruberi]EFC47698.1 predicted protein [Naegleria gruberi]|eukprot:XP_002680442.1 predicted protein [Naegleria gruberi strain NEG-M]
MLNNSSSALSSLNLSRLLLIIGFASFYCLFVYCDFPVDVKELNIKNIYADDSVDCNEFDYYYFNVPKDFKVQRFYLSFRFTNDDEDKSDKPALAIYFKIGKLANETDYDAMTNSPDIPIAFDKIPPDTNCYLTIAGKGMCKQGFETTNHYYFKGYLDKQGPIPE